MSIKTEITLTELHSRIENIREYMDQHKIEGLCIFGATRIFYYSGFHHLPTERPVVLVLPKKGELALLVPSLEEENIPVRTPHIKELKMYREYPGIPHPMEHLAELLADKGLSNKTLGVDSDNWGGGWGYRGPSLREVAPNAKLKNIRDVIDDIKMVKSKEELGLINISAHFANLAHGVLLENIEIGRTELDICNESSTQATSFMLKTMPPDWEPMGRSGANVSITSGPKTALNHHQAGARRIQEGDVILTYSGPQVGGYQCELERMLIIGKPTEKHKKYFDLEVKAQDAAFDAIKPGAKCCEIELAVNKFLEKNDLYSLTRTHIGHGLGMEGHEAPFFDIGDETVLKPGMVMSVEPCLFIPDYAGFRHSDTIVVTEDGMEMITNYPRDIENLTVAV